MIQPKVIAITIAEFLVVRSSFWQRNFGCWRTMDLR